MKELEILKEVLAACDFNDWHTKKGFDSVYVRNGLAFVSDGHFLVALNSSAAETSPPPFGEADKFFGSKVGGETYDLIKLKEFIAAQLEPKCRECNESRVKTCNRCIGSGKGKCCCECGKTSHRVTCSACDGTGKVDCECTYQSLPTSMFGRVIDARILGTALKPLPFRTFQINTGKDKESPCTLAGDGWRVVIMPTRAQAKCEWKPKEAEPCKHP